MLERLNSKKREITKLLSDMEENIKKIESTLSQQMQAKIAAMGQLQLIESMLKEIKSEENIDNIEDNIENEGYTVEDI